MNRNVTKGIVLAGGTGSRLFPLTHAVSKQLLPVYDKPLIYYPISTLMLADIRDILIITSKHELANFKRLLGDGSQFGVNFSYAVQTEPRGIAEALIIGEDFIGGEEVALILGDNIFYGNQLSKLLGERHSHIGATIFAISVDKPEQYGVVEVDENNKAISLEEKPEHPRSRLAVTGLYFFDDKASTNAKQVTPSKRGELEIIDVLKLYQLDEKLNVLELGRGFCWFDAGTHRSLADASNLVRTIEERQALKISCLEEIALSKNWIELDEIYQRVKRFPSSTYYDYVKQLSE